MNIPAALLLSIRNFMRRKTKEKSSARLVNAVIGIALSVMPLIVVLVVANGMIEGITRRYLEIGSFHAQITKYKSVENEEIEKLLEDVSQVPGINHAFTIRQGIGMLHSESGRLGVTVKALPKEMYEQDEQFRSYLDIVSGSFDLTQDRGVLLSQAVAEKLDVKVGDSVKLLTARSFPGRPVIIRPTRLVVSSVFSTGYHELDSILIYISYPMGEKLFQEPGSFYLGIKVDDPFRNIGWIAADIISAVDRGWICKTWEDIERSMFKSLSTTRNLLIFIMTLIVCVAAVNISSTLLMLVFEKHQEIAFLKSTGASPGFISFSFLCTGFYIGILGAFFGIAFGLLIAVNINEVIGGLDYLIELFMKPVMLLSGRSTVGDTDFTILNPAYYLQTIPVRINLNEIFNVAAMVLIISLGASFFPARKAGSLKPLEVLRKHG